jgi:hypothetical protein
MRQSGGDGEGRRVHVLEDCQQGPKTLAEDRGEGV